MKKFILGIILVFMCFGFGTNQCAKAFLHAENKNYETNFNEFFVRLFGDDVSRRAEKNEYVYISGSPVGFCLQSDGVVVIAVGLVESSVGKVSPCEGQDILPGDVLVSINGIRISSACDIEKIVNENDCESFEILFIRNKHLSVKHIVPAVDEKSGKARLGLWIRDSLSGVGTLTFVTEKNRFGALGHTMCDSDTGTILPVLLGKMYQCNIAGVVRGQKGEPGELKGVFVQNNNEVANVTKNNEFGLFGDYCNNGNISLQKFKVASQSEIHPGKAQIMTTIEGTEPQMFDIEIIKVNTQASQKSKSLVFRVTDGELLVKTGGIVQGMSGSPIIQDNKFVGAVTHVFVSDPSKGYGVYAEWMLEQ